MDFPEPLPGLVIRYSYLWFEDYRQGREEGLKDRPCAIVAAIKAEADGRLRAIVLPVTHSPPIDASSAIEIPAMIKEWLSLDAERSWIVISEWNEFVWPGPDLRRRPDGDNSSIIYGMLPPSFFRKLRQRFVDAVKSKRSTGVPRSG